MKEYREIYHRDGTPTGVSVEKHATRKPGDYFRHVVIVLKTSTSPLPGTGEGWYIVQQRSLMARYYAGKWDMTGGSVLFGETPEQAIVREVQEELHLHIPIQALTLAHQEIIDWDDGTGVLLYLYACRVNIPESGIIWDDYEVNDVQIMPFHQFREHIMDHNSEELGQALDRIEKTL